MGEYSGLCQTPCQKTGKNYRFGPTDILIVLKRRPYDWEMTRRPWSLQGEGVVSEKRGRGALLGVGGIIRERIEIGIGI